MMTATTVELIPTLTETSWRGLALADGPLQPSMRYLLMHEVSVLFSDATALTHHQCNDK